jgi:DNA primase
VDRSAVEAVKARINIADIIRRYVDLKPVSGRWMGACPFHQETKPSMSVNEDEGFFYCFGCQASGDVIDFYMRINGLEFRDALEQLATEAGVELKGYRQNQQDVERSRRKKLLMEMHDEAQHFFRNCLDHAVGQPARDYLQRRGTSPEIIERFGLGYSPDDWHGLDNFLKGRGRMPEDGVEAGLLSKNQKGNIYDRFRGRLIFPIKNLSGRVIAFGGRIITDGEPKYLNSSDSPIYKKGEHLYGLDVARRSMNRTRRALLTEGYMDVLSLHQFGYEDACGVLGTALTTDQVKRLAGLCNRVDLVFDGDGAGRKAALKSSRMILLQGAKCRVVLLPEGKDVDDVLQEHGRDGFEQCLDNARDGLDFCLKTLRDDFSPREIMDWAGSFLSELKDPALAAFFLPRLAGGLGLSEAELRRTFTGDRAPARGRNEPAPAASPAPSAVRKAAPREKESRNDRTYLTFCIKYPEYIPYLEGQEMHSVLSTEWARALWEKLRVMQPGEDALSRLNPEEKSFFIQCRNQLAENPLNGQELQQEWSFICNSIYETRKKAYLRYLRENIRLAQEQGDRALLEQYQRAYQEFLGRNQ